MCPAYLDQSRPCWQARSTLCEEVLRARTCHICEVHARYGPDPLPDGSDECRKKALEILPQD